MTRFEDELRWALQRRDPPGGFADRVLARLPATRPRRFRFLAALGRRWAPALATVWIAAFATGLWEYRQVQQRREGERAKQELIFALQVTSAKLQTTRAKLLHTLGGSL